MQTVPVSLSLELALFRRLGIFYHLCGVRGLAFRAWPKMTTHESYYMIQDELTAEQHKEEPVAEEEPAQDQEDSEEPAADEGDEEEEAEPAPEIVVRSDW